jgi:hypothetical protein
MPAGVIICGEEEGVTCEGWCAITRQNVAAEYMVQAQVAEVMASSSRAEPRVEYDVC